MRTSVVFAFCKFALIFSMFVSPTVGRPSVMNTSIFGRSFFSNCFIDDISESLILVPPVGRRPLINSSPRRRPLASAGINPRSIKCSSPAKLITLNRSPSRRVLIPKSNAARAFSIFPSSAIDPLVSSTKTMSLFTSSRSATSSFGESISRK